MPLPNTVSFETGASLGIPGLTATHCVLGDGPVTQKCVLVHGGAGNVGFLAVQLAKWSGARVIATASPKDFERCRGAGANAVIDYRSEQRASEILAAAGGQPVDRIVEVEFGLNIAANVNVIAPNGVIGVYGSQKEQTPAIPFYPLLFKAVTVEFALIYILPDAPRRKAIDNLHAALTEGAMTCAVDRIFPLSQTALAHESVESGARSGATLIDVNDG